MTNSDARTSAFRKSFAAFNAGLLMFSLIAMSFPVDALAQVVSPDVVETTAITPDVVVDPVAPVTHGDAPATNETPNTNPTGDTHPTDPTPPTHETNPTVNGLVSDVTAVVNPVCPEGTVPPTPPVGYDATAHGPFPYTENDCVPTHPVSGTCTIVSDTSTQVTGKGAAKILSVVHSAWATITGASWIWGDNPVSNPTILETQVFTRTFSLSSVPTNADIEIAVDNGVVLKVNGTEVANLPSGNINYNPTHSYDVTPLLHTGTNTIEATATNTATPDDSDPAHNPAGLIYKLTIDGSECGTVPPPTHHADVKICKVDENHHPLSGWTLMLKGDHVQSGLSVPATSSAGVSSNTLVAGMSYIATATGTWSNQNGANIVDTEYSTTNGWATQMDGYTGYQSDILELQINSAFDPNSNWGPYNSTHTYAQSFVQPSAGPANFRIFDGSGTTQNESWFGDNSGNLSVDIDEGYVGVTGENGCVTFDDVPFNDYTIDEVDQDGWTNVSGLQAVIVNADSHNFTVVNTNEDATPVGTCEAGVNLINNGSFEAPTVTTSEGWNVYASGSTGLSWLATWVGAITSFGGDTRPDAAQVEIQKNGLVAGWLASNGNQWAEIDTDWSGPTSAVSGEPAAINLYQDITTVPGKTYTVAFDYSARPDAAANENVIEASHGGVLGVTAGPLAGTGVTNWLPQTYSFVATSSSTRIAFRDAGTPDDSLGAFIDNVHVTCQPAAPEPTKQCVLGSNTTTLEGGSPSNIVTVLNARWTAIVSGFSWIWGEDPSTDTETGKTETFSKTFWLDTTAASSTLQIAADNAYTVTLNGTPIGGDIEEFNYGAPGDYGPGSGQDVITINPLLLVAGANTLVFTVNNFPQAGGTSGTNPGGLLYKLIVDGANCTENPPAQETLKVHIFKYLQTENSTAQVPNDSTAPAFPMTATWSATNIGAGTAGYVLGNYHGQPDLKYAADTSAMSAPANYTTSENTDGSVVLPIGSTCQADKYRLVGYKSGVTLAAAQADSVHATAPTYTGLTSDRYVIVVNEKCADDVPPVDTTTTLTIVKNAVGGDSVFSFNVTGAETWNPNITTTGDGHAGSTTKEVATGTYNVSEVVPTGWTLTGASCTGGTDLVLTDVNNTQSITLATGDDGVCTFTNTKDTTPPEQGTNTENTVVVRAADLDTETNLVAAIFNNSGKWFFYNDTTDVIDNSLGYFVTGPATAPAGDGSAEMALAPSPNNRKDIATFKFQGTMLEDLATLKFSAYSHSGTAGATESPYLFFNVDFTGTNSFQSRLVFVPSDNGPVPQDTWNTFDAINSGNAKWVYSGAVWPTTATGPDAAVVGESGTATRTWNEILLDYPNARILSPGGLMGVRVGEPGPDGYVGDVDKFVIGIQSGINSTTTTYDFEPDAVSETPGDGNQTPADTSSSRSSRSRSSGSVLGNSTGGEVLGASCGILIDTFMRENKANDSADVNDLKSFLNGEMGTDLSVNGMFDALTTAAVNAFQIKYFEDVLNPWVPFGLATNHTPTGYVYKTTAWKINMINCPELNLPMPQLP
ncbi:MAG: hypothetical protein JWN64_365 [Parcubacteria group bacterium]|nr:hypothetical protein [Parcubacteria group bacterium]